MESPTLSSALTLIKRMVDTWLSGESSPHSGELAAFIDALNLLKNHAYQKLHDDTETEGEPHIHTPSLRSRNVELRPSKRGRNDTERASSRKRAHLQSDSLFVNENGPGSDSDQAETGSEQERHGETSTHLQQAIAEQSQLTNRRELSEVMGQLNDPVWQPNDPVGELNDPMWDYLMGAEQGSGREQSVRLSSPEDVLPMIDVPRPFIEESSNEVGEAAERFNGEDCNGEAVEQATSTDITQHRIQSQNSAELDETGSSTDGSQLDPDLLPDPSSPRFFEEAFQERFGSEHGTAVNSPALDVIEPEYPPQNFANDPEFLPHLEMARRMGFCFPQERAGSTDETSVRERLSPLLEEKPLNTSLLHGLLYTVLPSPLRIFELCPTPSDHDFPRSEELVEMFVAIVPISEESTTLLLLGDPTAKVLHILASRSADTSAIGAFQSLPKRPVHRVRINEQSGSALDASRPRNPSKE
ncbi:hypothetical protein BU23DRAFT_644909 [Bimuria novae-zelandiae CBS 107.79]|uniref:Uncharacterized protein n=1 Tax=Bimuria novae-zelandiae CBS 107.79 TaxID=1447943 RepID=A0A6A5VFT7_9PLEO|nr:hypothetical protein BU23DRAFT_644909 [Bimuria novae-zelandiae CBS 107.79]